jgi:mannose-6-phosphate isomerase-like protein (cupin superfamily)
LLELGEATRLVRSGDIAYIPPHVPHALQNTGLGRLVFIVVTIPL